MARLGDASRWPLDRVVDIAFALALAGANVVNMYFPEASSAYDYPEPNALQIALGTVACLMFAVRRQFPVWTVLIAVVCTGIIAGAGWNAGFLPYALVLALYTIAAYRTLALAAAGLLATYVLIGILSMLKVPYFEDAYVLLVAAWYTGVWAAGLLARSMRADRDRERSRAIEAERTKAIAAAEARVQERLRIARDMHDVVAHTLSVMTVQAGLARVLLPARPDAAAEAIGRAEESARGATADLRRVLNVLRADSSRLELEPAPDARTLEALVAGEEVELDVSGAVETLPDSVRLTVFRIVQEGLTNVRKHAPGAQAHVRVSEQEGRVEVCVRNAGGTPPAQAADAGWGHTGLVERVEMYGGTFAAGRTPDGGYELRASL